MGSEDRSRRKFRRLISLLPFDFRADFGDEMEAAFEEQQDDARRDGGRRRSAWLWLLTAIDTVRLAISQHWDLLRQDVRFGTRTALRNPTFTCVVVLTLALGTGAVTAIFAVVDAVVFRPLPFPRSDRLVQLEVVRRERGGFRGGSPVFSYPQFEDVRNQSRVFDGIAAYGSYGDVTAAGSRSTVSIGEASTNLFQVLDVKPILGRTLAQSDETGRGQLVAVITHRVWRSLYASDPKVVGKRLADVSPRSGPAQPVIIVGVLPADFEFPIVSDPRQSIDAWLPATPNSRSSGDANARGYGRWRVVGRLKDAATLQAARSQLDTIARRLATAYPDHHGNEGLRVSDLHEYVVGPQRTPLMFFLSAVGVLLLIACANVTNLLLARGSSREREFALRAALGAGRMRVVRQMLTETTLLSLAGGVAGLALAYVGTRAFVYFSYTMPRLDQATIDLRVLAFTFLVVLFTAVVAGFVPVVRCSRRTIVEAITHANMGGAGGRRWLRPVNVLVVAQVALALTLLVGAGLMVTSFANLISADLGFDRQAVVTSNLAGSLSPMPASGGPTWREAAEQERKSGLVLLTNGQRRRAALNEEILRNVLGIRGVESAGIATDVPLNEASSRNGIRIDGETQPKKAEDGANMAAQRRSGATPLLANTSSASPEYFTALKISLVVGRFFDERDREGAPRVAIVSETIAKLCWPGKDPLGRLIGIGSNPPGRVVGVVRDSFREGPTGEPSPDVYYPFAQDPRSSQLVLRMSRMQPDLAVAIERAVNSADRGLHAGQVRVLDDVIWQRLVGPRFTTFLVATFSTLALVLALVGVHGVLAYGVARRTHEIGIRMALGGSHRRVRLMVLAEATKFAAVGGVAGLAGGIAVARVAKTLLFGVAPGDPTTLVAVSLVLVGSVVLAAYGPARKATRVDPIACLRQE